MLLVFPVENALATAPLRATVGCAMRENMLVSSVGRWQPVSGGFLHNVKVAPDWIKMAEIRSQLIAAKYKYLEPLLYNFDIESLANLSAIRSIHNTSRKKVKLIFYLKSR